MKYDIPQLLKDYHVPITEEGKNVSGGWITVRCPFCEDTSNHLGYNLAEGYFNCWRCGGHHINKVISTLLEVPESIIMPVLKQYSLRPEAKQEKQTKQKVKSVKLPYHTGPLEQKHKEYLWGRNFDADLLVQRHNLQATGNTGDYKFRIIAPIYYNKILVSYQGRDITNKSQIPYKACAAIDELMPHKHCLYGFGHAKKDSIVIVEGIADVWRMGPGSVATFGIGFTLKQIQLLKYFKKRFILFDSDPQAQEQATKLGNLLSCFTGETYSGCPNGDGKYTDPAEMTQDNADDFMRHTGAA